MSLRTYTPPSESLNALQAAIDDNQDLLSPEARITAGDPTPEATYAHEVYFLELDALANQSVDLSKDASAVGIRYVLGALKPGVMSILTTEDGAGYVCSALAIKGATGNTAEAIEAAKDYPCVKKSSYEARVLQVPSLYVSALWLKPFDGTDDRLVPMAPIPEFFQGASGGPGNPDGLSSEQFFKVLVSKAEALLLSYRDNENVQG